MNRLEKNILSGLIAVLALLSLDSCAPFQDSPFSDQLLSRSHDLNETAIQKLKDIDADGKIRIAVLADAHQNYGSLDKAVYDINRTGSLDFVVNLGDFTNSGYNLEYDQYIDSYSALRYPALTVLGNHDALGAGPHLFRKAFSDPNYFFESATKRFVFFNSASLEDPEGFNLQWLQDTISSSSKSVIIFTHCSLKDPERFSGTVAQAFDAIIADPKVILVLNGHNHVYNLDTSQPTVLLQAPRVEGTSWLLLEITGTQMHITNQNDGTDTWVTLKN